MSFLAALGNPASTTMWICLGWPSLDTWPSQSPHPSYLHQLPTSHTCEGGHPRPTSPQPPHSWLQLHGYAQVRKTKELPGWLSSAQMVPQDQELKNNHYFKSLCFGVLTKLTSIPWARVVSRQQIYLLWLWVYILKAEKSLQFLDLCPQFSAYIFMRWILMPGIKCQDLLIIFSSSTRSGSSKRPFSLFFIFLFPFEGHLKRQWEIMILFPVFNRLLTWVKRCVPSWVSEGGLGKCGEETQPPAGHSSVGTTRKNRNLERTPNFCRVPPAPSTHKA